MPIPRHFWLEFRQEGRRRGEEIGNENSMYVWYIHGTKFRFSKGRWRKKNDQYNIIFGRSVGLSRGPRCRFGYPAISHMEFSVRETGSFLIDSLTNASLRTGFWNSLKWRETGQIFFPPPNHFFFAFAFAISIWTFHNWAFACLLVLPHYSTITIMSLNKEQPRVAIVGCGSVIYHLHSLICYSVFAKATFLFIQNFDDLSWSLEKPKLTSRIAGIATAIALKTRLNFHNFVVRQHQFQISWLKLEFWFKYLPP